MNGHVPRARMEGVVIQMTFWALVAPRQTLFSRIRDGRWPIDQSDLAAVLKVIRPDDTLLFAVPGCAPSRERVERYIGWGRVKTVTRNRNTGEHHIILLKKAIQLEREWQVDIHSDYGPGRPVIRAIASGPQLERLKSGLRVEVSDTAVPSHTNRLVEDLAGILKLHPDVNKHRLLDLLTSYGWRDLSTDEVNAALHGEPVRFVKDNALPPRWRLSAARPAPRRRRGAIARRYAGPEPRVWQAEALEQWRAAGARGVVEAVTGTGKTAVGVLAAAEMLDRGGKALIVVPSCDLLRQWHGKLVDELPSAAVGRLGDGRTDALGDYDVIVATVQSACRRHMLGPEQYGLLVADEVHRYGTEVYARVLQDEFTERLGLTATYEREDNGIGMYLARYFLGKSTGHSVHREVVAGCDYSRGLNDRILASFRVGLLGVSLTRGEQSEYEELNATVKRTRAILVEEYGCPRKPFGEFMRCVADLAKSYDIDPAGAMQAQKYLQAFSSRRALLADCRRKLDAIDVLGPLLRASDRAIVFAETVESAQKSAKALRRLGVEALDYTSALSKRDREERLSEFREGNVRVLAAPRVLDEGVDVPEADVGVIVAASSSRRQMIQRMGRIIRPKQDGRSATFIVLYVRESSEDPARGAHSVFLNEMLETAEDVRDFGTEVTASQLMAWYSGQ